MQNAHKIKLVKRLLCIKERLPRCVSSSQRNRSETFESPLNRNFNEIEKTSTNFKDCHLRIPILTTYDAPLFPKFQKTITVQNVDMQRIVENSIHGKVPFIGVFLRKNETELVEKFDQLHKIGTLALIQRLPNSAENMNLSVNGLHRIEAIRAVSSENNIKSISEVEYCLAKFRNVNTSNYFRALTAEVVRTIRDVTEINLRSEKLFLKYLGRNVKNFGDIEFLCDLGASITRSEAEELQNVMNEMDIEKRLMVTLRLLKTEMNRSEWEKEILVKTAQAVDEIHKKYVMKQHMKCIYQELNTKDLKQSLIETYESRLSNKTVPPNVAEVIDTEMNKLKTLNSSNLEFGNVKQYLDWLTALPWGKTTPQDLDLEFTKQLLDKSHFGMEVVKERILEFLALAHFQSSGKGKVICLEGSSGVGKTSVANSIAKAVNRPYYRIAVGGLANLNEMKGHHRIYAGAFPGKIVQGLKSVQTENPVILIDEIDKYIYADEILPEIFDAKQNHEFFDNYLNLPVDLSKVLFICTANNVHKLSNALVDHLEVISLPGYSRDEKMMITKNFLLPKLICENGLSNGTEPSLFFKENTLDSVLDMFWCDPGIRGINQKLDQIIRQMAFKRLKGERDFMEVTKENLPVFIPSSGTKISRNFFTKNMPGIVRTLDFTQQHKNLILIEVRTSPGHNDIQLSGMCNEKIRESTEVAITLAQNFLNSIDIKNNFFHNNKVHINIPYHSTAKDGSNVGIAVTTALLSMALQKPVQDNIAVIGSTSLQGQVLPVHLEDISELCSFAQYHGICQILLPHGNGNQHGDLDMDVKNKVEITFVKKFQEVFNVIFVEKYFFFFF